MTCKDLIKIIQDLHLEEYYIFEISLDYSFDTGDFALCKNYMELSYPEFKDCFEDAPAERYDGLWLSIDMETGTILRKESKHCDSSTEEFYPY